MILYAIKFQFVAEKNCILYRTMHVNIFRNYGLPIFGKNNCMYFVFASLSFFLKLFWRSMYLCFTCLSRMIWQPTLLIKDAAHNTDVYMVRQNKFNRYMIRYKPFRKSIMNRNIQSHNRKLL